MDEVIDKWIKDKSIEHNINISPEIESQIKTKMKLAYDAEIDSGEGESIALTSMEEKGLLEINKLIKLSQPIKNQNDIIKLYFDNNQSAATLANKFNLDILEVNKILTDEFNRRNNKLLQ